MHAAFRGQRLRFWSLLIVLCASVSTSVSAQSLVVSARPVDGWIDTLKELARKAFPAQIATPFVDAIEKTTGPEALAGLDRTRSWGIFADLPSGGEPPLATICLPVTDADALMKSLKSIGMGVDEQPGRKTFSHVVTLPDGVTKLYAFPVEKYLYLSMFPGRPERFKGLKPAQFETLRPATSLLTIAARMDQIPQAIREQFIEGFEARMKLTAERRPDEPEAEFIGRQTTEQLLGGWVRELARSGKELAFDVEVDPKNGPIAVEMRLSAQKGSDLARSIESIGSKQSQFRALGADSVLDARLALPVPVELRKAFQKVGEQAQKDALAKFEKDSDKATIAAIGQWTQKALAADTMDAFVAIRGPYKTTGSATETHAVLFGLQVEDVKQFEKLIRESDRSSKSIVFDAAKSNDGKISLHQLVSPQDLAAKPDRMLGKLTGYVAVLDRSVLIAVGQESLPAIREALELIQKPTSGPSLPLAATVDLVKLMAFARDGVDQAATAKASRDAFKDVATSKRRLAMTMRNEGETLRLRIDADVMLLNFLTELGLMTQQAVRP